MLAKKWASQTKLEKLSTIEEKPKKSHKFKKVVKKFVIFLPFFSEKRFYNNKIVINLYA